MAEVELTQLAKATCEKFPIHDLFCKHRIGRVDVGETSLHVSIGSKHRKEGLDAMTWFISELKKESRFGNGRFWKTVQESPVNVLMNNDYTLNFKSIC